MHQVHDAILLELQDQLGPVMIKGFGKNCVI